MEKLPTGDNATWDAYLIVGLEIPFLWDITTNNSDIIGSSRSTIPTLQYTSSNTA